jgi:hypothetical protein
MVMFAMRSGMTHEVGRSAPFSDGRRLPIEFTATAVTHGLCSVLGTVPA